MTEKNKCERLLDSYLKLLLARQQIDESITDKTKRIDVRENATKALNSLLYELRGYEIVDLRPLIQYEKLKEKYDSYSYLEALTDALPVEWIGREVSNDELDDLFYCAVCKNNGMFLLFEENVWGASDIDLDTGWQLDFRPLLESRLSNVMAFRTKEDALEWLKKKDTETSHECHQKIILRLQSEK